MGFFSGAHEATGNSRKNARRWLATARPQVDSNSKATTSRLSNLRASNPPKTDFLLSFQTCAFSKILLLQLSLLFLIATLLSVWGQSLALAFGICSRTLKHIEFEEGDEDELFGSFFYVGDEAIPPFEVVQNPPLGPFNADILLWSTIHNAHDGHDHDTVHMAHIPFSRVGDFIEGEEMNRDAPTNFRKTRTKTNPQGTLPHPRSDSFLQRTWYWCAYGPKDLRGMEPMVEDRSKRAVAGSHTRRTITQRGEGATRGCHCNFSVKQFYIWSNVVEICYFQMCHVDVNGLPCHSKLDASSLFSPKLSRGLKRWIAYNLKDLKTHDQIMDDHKTTLVQRVSIASIETNRGNVESSVRPFERMVDGFGNTIKRAIPIVEKILTKQKRRNVESTIGEKPDSWQAPSQRARKPKNLMSELLAPP